MPGGPKIANRSCRAVLIVPATKSFFVRYRPGPDLPQVVGSQVVNGIVNVTPDEQKFIHRQYDGRQVSIVPWCGGGRMPAQGCTQHVFLSNPDGDRVELKGEIASILIRSNCWTPKTISQSYKFQQGPENFDGLSIRRVRTSHEHLPVWINLCLPLILHFLIKPLIDADER